MQASSTLNAPMTKAILTHLLNEGSISNVEAQNVHRCRALPRRISDLRAHGYDIRRTWHTDVTGQRYVRYHLKGGPERA